MTLVERARVWAGTEDAKRVAVALRILFFAAMFTWLVLKVRAIGWRQVAGSLPTNPLFYILFFVNFLILPASETVIYRIVFRQRLPRAFPVLIRKRVYNSTLVGYSGELMFAIWLKRSFGLKTKRILVALKDNAILSAVSSGLVTAALLVLFAATGNARRIMDWLHPGPALVVAGVLAAVFVVPVLYRLRRHLIALTGGQAVSVLGIHVSRTTVVVLLQATQWAVVLPAERWSTWLVFLTAQMVISRLPIIPNRDLLFLSAGLEMSNTIAGPRAAMAGLLLAGGALTQAMNLGFFIITSFIAQPPKLDAREMEEVDEADEDARIPGTA
ncbi:hypothetical protein KZ810_00840 [Sphingomonas sp. RHCKR47]|uniref:hypothetical protein n=1 Tax=Sphingomonas citricola TaxID=2862498 RepID=UPI001CA51622|nr:hypothetical protein [Sphingomonas citricola]MBW6522033.1 hypothetical protein [Sphingomonas citricola]